MRLIIRKTVYLQKTVMPMYIHEHKEWPSFSWNKELVGLFNVVAPTLRAAKRRIYKLGILQPFTAEQRIPLKEGYQVVYNLEMIFALAFQINTYPAQQLREYIISRLFQSEKSMIICIMNGNHKSYLKC